MIAKRSGGNFVPYAAFCLGHTEHCLSPVGRENHILRLGLQICIKTAGETPKEGWVPTSRAICQLVDRVKVPKSPFWNFCLLRHWPAVSFRKQILAQEVAFLDSQWLHFRRFSIFVFSPFFPNVGQSMKNRRIGQGETDVYVHFIIVGLGGYGRTINSVQDMQSCTKHHPKGPRLLPVFQDSFASSHERRCSPIFPRWAQRTSNRLMTVLQAAGSMNRDSQLWGHVSHSPGFCPGSWCWGASVCSGSPLSAVL